MIQQYPLPDAMGIAKDIFKRLTVLASEIPVRIREEYFQPIVHIYVVLARYTFNRRNSVRGHSKLLMV